jgi:hypothetical protein
MQMIAQQRGLLSKQNMHFSVDGCFKNSMFFRLQARVSLFKDGAVY